MSAENKNENIKDTSELMEKVVSLCKRRGFVFQGSEIYGGLAGTYDFGHYGIALRNNIQNAWWKKFVDSRRDMYGVDAAILMRQEVWQNAGHVENFADPMVECKKCGSRFRADTLISDVKEYEKVKSLCSDVLLTLANNEFGFFDKIADEARSIENVINSSENTSLNKEQKDSIMDILVPKFKELVLKMEKTNKKIEFFVKNIETSEKYIGTVMDFYLNRFVLCPNISCKAHNSWGESQRFNMMFQTRVGASEDSSAISYLRPETAQGMFVNFKNTVDAFHPKLPFGLAQIGKAFRNEITPRDFIFRVREFSQMEIEYFVRSEDWEKYFEYWKGEILDWMEEIGIDMNKVHELEVPEEDRAHYSKRTVDFEFDFPFGKKELFGLAYRTDFDLNNHKLDYVDEEKGSKIVPHVIEPTFGVERAFLSVLLSAYAEDEKDGEIRPYLKFKPNIAPVICAVSPLLKNKPELVEYANTKVYAPLKAEFGRVVWDDNGNIGKRYRRQDEIGTPYCIVIDFDTLTDDTVTVRDRDTGEQERIKVSELSNFIKEKIN